MRANVYCSLSCASLKPVMPQRLVVVLFALAQAVKLAAFLTERIQIVGC